MEKKRKKKEDPLPSKSVANPENSEEKSKKRPKDDGADVNS